jgi:hypothetical protein
VQRDGVSHYRLSERSGRPHEESLGQLEVYLNHVMNTTFSSAGLILYAATFAVLPLVGQENTQGGYPPRMEGSAVEVYKTAGDTALKLYIYRPKDIAATDKRPVIAPGMRNPPFAGLGGMPIVWALTPTGSPRRVVQ